MAAIERPESLAGTPLLENILTRCSYLLNEVAILDRRATLTDDDILDVLPPFAQADNAIGPRISGSDRRPQNLRSQHARPRRLTEELETLPPVPAHASSAGSRRTKDHQLFASYSRFLEGRADRPALQCLYGCRRSFTIQRIRVRQEGDVVVTRNGKRASATCRDNRGVASATAAATSRVKTIVTP